MLCPAPTLASPRAYRQMTWLAIAALEGMLLLAHWYQAVAQSARCTTTSAASCVAQFDQPAPSVT